MTRPRYRLSPGNGPRPVSLEPADDADGSFWCERCGAEDEEEAFGSCDGSGVEDDGKPRGSVARVPCPNCGKPFDPEWAKSHRKTPAKVCSSCAWAALIAFINEEDPEEEKPQNAKISGETPRQ